MQQRLYIIFMIMLCIITIDAYHANSNNRSELLSRLQTYSNSSSIVETDTSHHHRRLSGLFDIFFPDDLQRKSCKLYERLAQNGSSVERQLKVLVFVDSIYLNVFANWLAFYKAACSNDTSSLELICMDQVSHAGLERLGLSCSERSFKLLFDRKKSIFDGKLTNIWVKRMELVLDFLREGTDIILSDTDAIWRGNPFPDISRYAFETLTQSANTSITVPPSDIIASRAWWPWPLYYKWGSTVCMGFIYIKATAFTADLFTHVTENMREQLFNYTHNISRTRPDDQLAVNYQLFHWNISWGDKKMDVEKNRMPDFGIISYPGNRNSKGGASEAVSVTVTLLPHVNYVRNCHNQTKNWRFHSPLMQKVVRNNLAMATIAHCRVSTGLGKDKRDYLAAYKLWTIPLSVNNTMHPLYGLRGVPMRGDKNNGLYTKEQIAEMIRMRKEMLKKLRKQKKQKALRKRLKKEILMALYEEEKLQQSSASSSSV